MHELPEGTDVTDYRSLVLALRRRRQDLELSCEAVDAMAGLSDRYMNKLENMNSPNGRHLGEASLPRVLRALGVKLVLVADSRPRKRRRDTMLELD